MIADVGHVALWAGVACAAGATTCATVAATTQRRAWLTAGRWCMGLTGACAAVAAGALLCAFVSDDMRVEYVAAHSERAMSLPMKISAVWAGQEGSRLLWALFVAIFGAIIAATRRAVNVRADAMSLLVMAIASLFALLVLPLAADPFIVSGSGIADGLGLHPLLRHWAMMVHPPIVFFGYAASLVPLALLAGGLFERERSAAVLESCRAWTLLSWIPLGAGMAIGAWWAYVQLGWGGYWAWDPVENASLLPWLTGAALFHVLLVVRRSGTAIGWAFVLCLATGVLCLLGMSLTRSGMIQSVHAFGRTTVGPIFLGGAAGLALMGAAVGSARREALREDRAPSAESTRDGLVRVVSVLLVGMAIVTLVGTLLPVLSRAIGGHAITVGAGFYNRLVLPLGLGAAALMAVGPLLPHGRLTGARVWKVLCLPTLVAAGACGLGVGLGLREPIAFASIAVCCGGGVLVVRDLATRGRAGLGAPGIAAFGGRVAHAGVLLLVAGVAGSGLFGTTQSITIAAGERASVAGRTVRLVQLRESREDGRNLVSAEVVVASGGTLAHLTPRRVFYDKSEEVGTRVAIQSGPWRDVSVALVGWEAKGERAALQVRVIPMMLWIWIGAGTMTCGGAMCLLARVAVRRAGAASPAELRPDGREPIPAVCGPGGAT